jgi:formylglycine-generating enzyme required for sulfatase activity
MGEISSLYPGDSRPIYQTSWESVQLYISRLNASTGKNYRLPTEAEWEYAARGGNKSKGYKYSGSNNIDEVAWYGRNANRLNLVGQLKPNELGIYDMSGNVFEFCSDSYGDYTADAQINPTGYGINNSRVLRGGAWQAPLICARNSYRTYLSTGCCGLRLVHP